MGELVLTKLTQRQYILNSKQKRKTKIMKLAVAVVFVSVLIAPQVMNAIAMPNPNDNTLDPSDPISDNICKCSGKTVKELSGNILGECQHKASHNNKFFCYIDKTSQPEKCCEDTTGRFQNACINYSICSSPDTPEVHG